MPENTYLTEHTQFVGVKEMTGTRYLDEFANVPLVQRYQKQGIPFDDAVNVFESYISSNPFLALYEAKESDFKTPNDYDLFLVKTWCTACEVTNYNYDLALEAVFGDKTEFYHPTTEVVDTVKGVANKIYNYGAQGDHVGYIRAAKHRIVDKNLSPIWKGLQNQVNNLIGDEAAKEEVIKNSKLLELRRLFLKLLTVYYSQFITGAVVSALLPGGAAMMIIKWLIGIVLFVGRGAFYVATVKRAVVGGDPQHEDAKKKCLYELELELKMVREKINDARSHGKDKEKYQLMRVEASIEKEIYRIRYGTEPDRNLSGRGND